MHHARRDARHRRFHHHVRVGAAKTKGAYPCQTPAFGPRRGLGGHEERGALKIDEWIQIIQMRMRWNFSMHEAERGLYDTCHAGCGLQVSNIGFGRSQCAALLLSTPRRQYGLQGFNFDRITKRCTRAVSFNVSNLRCLDARSQQGLAHHSLLGQTIRRGKTIAATILIHRRTPNHRHYAVAIARCIIKAFKKQ